MLLLLLLPGGHHLAQAAPASPRPRYLLPPGGAPPVALLRTGPATYLVTQRAVLRLDGSRFVAIYESVAPIQCAALADTGLWLGTRQGLLKLDVRRQLARPRPLPEVPAATADIRAVFRDLGGALWVGVFGAGVFHEVRGQLMRELSTPAISAGLATADSSIWIGTNIGLSRKRTPRAEWTRYNEEGVANQEIPDNLIEKLLPDNAGNVWAVMSDAICVFEATGQRGATEAELPTAKFLGQPGNELLSVAFVPGAGRLFATAQGLLLLPVTPATKAGAPLPAPEASTDRVQPQRLLRPLPPPPGATAPPRLLWFDNQRRQLWLVSAAEVGVLSAKEVRAWAGF